MDLRLRDASRHIARSVFKVGGCTRSVANCRSIAGNPMGGCSMRNTLITGFVALKVIETPEQRACESTISTASPLARSVGP